MKGKGQMKITIEVEGQSKIPPVVFEGKRAEMLTAALEKVWGNYQRQEKEMSHIFDQLLEALKNF